MSEVKLIITQLNDAPRLFIDGQEAKGIVAIDYKYVTSEGDKFSGVHRYTIKYFDDLNKEQFNQDPTIKTITVQKMNSEEESKFVELSQPKSKSFWSFLKWMWRY